jgi:hypothetical protein
MEPGFGSVPEASRMNVARWTAKQDKLVLEPKDLRWRNLNFSLRTAETRLFEMAADGVVEAQKHLSAIWKAQNAVGFLCDADREAGA